MLHLSEKKNIIRTTLHSFTRPFEALQADIARSVVDPKFCLSFVDLSTSKIYTYPMKKRNLLAKKIELFYKDIEKKKDWTK